MIGLYVDDMTAYTHEENLQYMTETYDLTREELDGVDIDRFIEDYGLREEEVPRWYTNGRKMRGWDKRTGGKNRN